MSNTLKRSCLTLLVLTVLCLFAPHVVRAEVIDSGSYGSSTWELEDSGLLTIRGTGVVKESGFSSSSYANYDKIIDVIIEPGIKEIRSNAFNKCKNMKSISIPDSVTKIGSQAFYECSALESVVIPPNVTKIDSKAFYMCTGLREVTIPEGVTSIGDSAFYYCEKLETADIPSSVTSIWDKAFYHCSALTAVVIPEGMTSIRVGTFSNCSHLASVTIPDSVQSIAADAFSYCVRLESVVIPEGVTRIENSAFYACRGMVSVSLPQSLTSIGTKAFYNCESLPGIEIPDGVSSIESEAFYGCESLTAVALPASMTSVSEKAFMCCSKLAKVTIPEGVTQIGTRAFCLCGLTSIDLPDSLISIGESSFAECTELRDVVIPGNVTTIGIKAFSGCNDMGSVTIPESVTSISGDSFYSSSAGYYYFNYDLLFYLIKGSYADKFCSSCFHKDQIIYLYSPEDEETEGCFALRYSELGLATGSTVNLSECLVLGEGIELSDIAVSGNDSSLLMVSNGRAAALSAGTTELVFTYGDESLHLPVWISDSSSELTGLGMTEDNVRLKVGEMKALTLVVRPVDAPAPAASELTWTSSDETVASVANGIVLGNGPGQADITASCASGITAVCHVEVYIPAKKIITVKDSVEMEPGKTHKLGYYIYPSDNTDEAPVLFSSSDETVATVSSNGVVAAVTYGAAEITIRKGDLQEVVSVTVCGPLKGISLDKKQAQIYLGDTVQLAVIYDPEYTTSDTDRTVAWSSDAVDVASVDENGCVTANSEGIAEITAKVGDYTASFMAICRKKPHYTVTYTDGFEDEEIFEDQMSEVELGDQTPTYEGDISEPKYYSFTGWTPEVAQTVTADVTYTATWEHCHVLDLIEEIEPGCTTEGQKAHYRCGGCGKLFMDTEGTQEIEDPSMLVIAAMGHDWGDASYVWTEEADGGYTVTASRVCGTDVTHLETETVTAAYEITSAADCTQDGEGKYTAAFENEAFAEQTKAVVIPAVGHKEEIIPGKAATCTESGLTEGKKCSVCGEVTVKQEEIPAKGHVEETIPGKAATCTESGLTEGKKCSVCGEVLVKQEEIPAKGHVEETIPGKAATCTESGLTEGKKCSVCGEVLVKQEEIPAKGHIEEVIPAVAPTCTKAGSKAGKKCSVCGEVLEAPEEVEALGHDYQTDAGSAVEATCTKAGKEADQKCSRCDDLIEGKEIPAKGHTEEVIPAVAPTCTKAGSTVGKKCSVCGEVLVKQEEIPAKGHVEETIPGKAATCTESGLTEGKKCSVCGEVLVKQEEIPAKGHTEEEVFAVPPTCTETGFTAGKKCSVCGAPLEAPKEVAALGHKWDNGKVINQPTVSAPGVKTYTCEVCGETRDETIAKLTPAEDPVLGSVTTLDSKAKALSENGDPAGSGFRILQVKGKKVAKTSITISWKKVRGATGYVIYGAPCGSKYRKIKEVKGTSYKQTGLKKGKYYKYFVSARDKSGKILASSKTVHIATSGGKKGNTKSVKLNKKKVPLKKGKTFKLKAKLKNGKLKVSNHRKVAYESDNPKVATVSGSGKIKAKSKGTCTIYAYAQNGVFAKCKVTVK